MLNLAKEFIVNKEAVRETIKIRTTRFGDGGADHEAWENAQAQLTKLAAQMAPKDLAIAARGASMVASATRRRAAALNAG
jgi:hypothetical protein